MHVGRNDKCPCGSGKKYKKCCIDKDDAMAGNVWKQHQEFIEKERVRKEALGEVRPIIHLDYKGFKLVVCGSTLHYSKKWKTFTDFLFDYVKDVLGRDWGNTELKKPEEEKHQIIKLYQDVCKIQAKQAKGSDGIYSMVPTGPMAAYICLAYDLFILADNLRLQKEVVRRLKIKQQFQGARYELQVAATCIKAGFDVNYEDESDISKRHPEFVAKHKRTGQILAVEAKSRHRPGVLGHPGEAEPPGDVKATVANLLNKAIEKKPDHPYAIFIDLNMPSIKEEDVPNLMGKELIGIIEGATKKYGGPPDPFNHVIFTNHPHHYGDSDSVVRGGVVISTISRNALQPVQAPEALIELHEAAIKYGNVPSVFPT